MKKFFQRGVLKLKLLGFGAGTLLASWAGVQYLETERVIRSHEKQMALERELQLEQKVSELNRQIVTANQEIQQKNTEIQTVLRQLIQQRSLSNLPVSSQAGAVQQASQPRTVQQAPQTGTVQSGPQTGTVQTSPQSGTVQTVLQKSTKKPVTRTKAS